MKKDSLRIEIGYRTIIFTILFIIGVRFLDKIHSILIALFIAFLIATAVYPLVKSLAKFKIPRALSATLILMLVLASIIAAFASLIPPVVTETTNLINNLPKLIEQLSVYNLDLPVTSQIGSLSGNILKIALDTFSITIILVTIFVISFFLIMERGRLDQHMRTLFGEKADKYKTIYLEIETQLGHWVRAMIFLMVLIGVQTYIGLILIGLDYALPLAILAGLLEIVPNLGPTISAIPAIIVGFAISPVHGLLTVGLYILVQQLENSLIVPNLMKKTIGLHPVVTIVALLIGFEIGGALLAVLSLPLVLVGKVLFTHIYHHQHNN